MYSGSPDILWEWAKTTGHVCHLRSTCEQAVIRLEEADTASFCAGVI